MNTKYLSLLAVPLILSLGLVSYFGFEEASAQQLPDRSLPTVVFENGDVTVSSLVQERTGGDGVAVSGYVVIEVFDKNGNLKSHTEDHNLVVDNGLETLADLAFGTTHSTGESLGGFDNISVGSSATAPAAGQTDCITQNGNKKVDSTVTNTALGGIIDVSWVAELPAVTLTEICLTDSPTNATGNLFARQTYGGVTISTSDTVNAQWTITFADSNGT
jgi:hypothetical protein